MSDTVGTGRMVVIYKTPRDIAAFEHHYHNVHIPLAKKLPGLLRYEVSRSPIAAPAGQAPYLIGTLFFDDLGAIKAAFESSIGRECAADRRILAPDDGDVQIFLYDTGAV